MTETFRNPIITDDQGGDHGDPFVMKYRDTYYLYHTGRNALSLYTSRDLVNWEYVGQPLTVRGPEHWAQVDLWAPEVMYHEGKFYCYVAATPYEEAAAGAPHGASSAGDRPRRADDQARRQGLARSDSPLGPFVWDDEPLVPEVWSIDGHPYRDEDGQLWFFYNIRTDETRYKDGTIGCGNVVDRMLAPDRLEGFRSEVAFPSERWEGNKESTWYWNEGPFVMKRRSTYYQMYSGGFYGDDTYGVGFATAPAPRGPWTKYAGNPILRSGESIKGPGHHCVVKGPDGVTPYAVYHGYIPGGGRRKDHIDRLFWVGDRLDVVGPTDGDQPVPPGPVFDQAVPHWYVEAWVKGRSVTVGGVTVELPSAYDHKVEAIRAEGTLRILVDGAVRHTGPAGDGTSDLSCDGEVAHVTRTSWLEDERLYDLPEDERRVWTWGGSGPVELAVAVKGRATITAGDWLLPVEAPADRFELVRALIPGGAGEVEILGGSGGAVVTDLVLTARG